MSKVLPMYSGALMYNNLQVIYSSVICNHLEPASTLLTASLSCVRPVNAEICNHTLVMWCQDCLELALRSEGCCFFVCLKKTGVSGILTSSRLSGLVGKLRIC